MNARSSVCLLQGRLLRLDGGLRHALRLDALVEGLLRDGGVELQALAARQIGIGEGEIGFGLLERGLRLVECGLERAAVDGEQLIARLHHLSVAEVDRVEVAGDARAHLDRIDGDEAADVLLLVRHRFPHRTARR